MVRQAFEAIGRAFQARCPLGDPKRVAQHTVFLLVLASAAHAQTSIKLATLVPDGSVWDKNIKQMGEEWKTATGGRVTVTVFAGGSQGDESTVLRKMRLDALQAASFSAVGLGN